MLGNILFVTAHPDDLEISAGGTVAKLIREGHKVFSFICATPNQATVEVRTREAFSAMALYGLEGCFQIGPWADTELYKHINEMVAKIDYFVQQYKIDTVFTHHPGDSHQDHWAVSQASGAGSRHVKNLLYFRPSSPSANTGIQFLPNLVMDLDRQDIMLKMKALECHASQISKYGRESWLERMRDSAKADSWIYNGFHGYAEVFMVSRLSL